MVRDVVDQDNPDSLAGAPAVFVPHLSTMKITAAWQKHMVAINPGMALQYVTALLGSSKAFANTTGFPGRINYIPNEDLDAPELPKFDKCRTCARSVFTGVKDGDYLIPNLLDEESTPRLNPLSSIRSRIPGCSLPRTTSAQAGASSLLRTAKFATGHRTR